MAGIVVLGGGAAGISAAWHARRAGREVVVFEARERWGGLLDHFEVGGFRFDMGAHFGFSGNEPYRRVLETTDCIVHRPEPYNYERGRWLKHPVQNNLYPLPPEERVEAIKSFIERPEVGENADYGQWLAGQFGQVIAERFPARYTRKYWTVPAGHLGTEWVGNRLYRPTLEEVLFGAMTDRTPPVYYIREMFYPRRGGFRSFFEPLAAGLDIRTGREAVFVDPRRCLVEFRDGGREHYETLVSSLPLPVLVEMIEDVPRAVRDAAASLWATSAALVSLGTGRPRAGDHLWFYIYDREILPARVHSPSMKSPDNAPPGCSSLQFETYFSRHAPLGKEPEELVEHVTKKAVEMGLLERSDITAADCRVLPYANVVFERGMTGKRGLVLDYIRGLNILPIGRFGEWDYLWTDQAFLSGKKIEGLPGML